MEFVAYWLAAFADYWTTRRVLLRKLKPENSIIRRVWPFNYDLALLTIKVVVFAAFKLLGVPAWVFWSWAGAWVVRAAINYRLVATFRRKGRGS